MKPNSPDNFINFGYGYLQSLPCQYDHPRYPFPIGRISSKIPMNSPLYFLPPAIAPDEVFVPLSEYVVSEKYKLFDRYIISNYGRLFDTFVNTFVPTRYNKPFNPDGSNNGYLSAHVACYSDPYTITSKDIYIHRAVLFSFYPINNPYDFEVDHINMIKSDNRLCNLRYVTSRENMKMAAKTIAKADRYKGSSSKRYNINIDDAENICKLYAEGYDIVGIANKLGIDFYSIVGVLSGNMFKEVYTKYNFSPISLSYSIPEDAIHKICKLIQDGVSISDISSRCGVDKYLINDIKNRKIYQNISINYDFSNVNNIESFTRTLQPEIVHEICRRLQLGGSPIAIGRDLKVNPDIVANIKARKAYTEISRNYIFPDLVNKMSNQLIHNICLDMQNGMRDKDIAEKYNTNVGNVGHIRRGETHTDISSQYKIPQSHELGQQRALDNATIHEICRRLANNESPTLVANDMNIPIGLIHSIKSRSMYNDISSQYTFNSLASVVTPEQVRIACLGLQNGDRTGKILTDSGISKRTLYRIRDREIYTDISKDYNW